MTALPTVPVPSMLLSRRSLALFALLGFACRRKEPLPEHGTLPAFELTDQSGKPCGTAQLRGGVWVAAFLFTRCPTICPRITRRMRELQIEAKSRALPVSFVAFSVDPDYDTPEVLRAYAAKHEIDLTNFRYLTGELEVIRKTAVDGFKMALEGRPDSKAEHLGILHGSHLVLVDQKLAIRGFYRTESAEENESLLTDVERLG